jgi:hypothetical protein
MFRQTITLAHLLICLCSSAKPRPSCIVYACSSSNVTYKTLTSGCAWITSPRTSTVAMTASSSPTSPIDWQYIRDELLTVGQICAAVAKVSRPTLIEWRKRETDPFPAPVLTLPSAHPIELWARQDVQTWLEHYR